MKINALFSALVPDSALPASSIFPDAISDHLINGIGIKAKKAENELSFSAF
jgi:hypothetical protein